MQRLDFSHRPQFLPILKGARVLVRFGHVASFMGLYAGETVAQAGKTLLRISALWLFLRPTQAFAFVGCKPLKLLC
jgi:hypothetical protein